MSSSSQLSRPRGPRSWTALSPSELECRFAFLGLYLDTTAPAILCRVCGYALKPSAEGVSKHLWEKHQIPAKDREGLNGFVKSLRLPAPDKLDPCSDGRAPHPHLVVRPGLACKRCDFRSTSRDLVQRHLSKKHGRRSNDKTWQRDGIHDDLRLQSWTQNGTRGYWIVETEDPLETVPVPASEGLEASPRRRERLVSLHDAERQRISHETLRRPSTDKGIDDMALTSNWMRRTGWTELFAGVNRHLLLSLAEPPAPMGSSMHLGDSNGAAVYSSASDEGRLLMIGRAVDRFFDRCDDTLQHTDHSLRCWLRSQVPGRPYKAPFQAPGRQQTVKRYRALWKGLIYFVTRLCRLEDQVLDDALGMQPSEQQRAAVRKMWILSETDIDSGRRTPTRASSGHVDLVTTNGQDAVPLEDRILATPQRSMTIAATERRRSGRKSQLTASTLPLRRQSLDIEEESGASSEAETVNSSDEDNDSSASEEDFTKDTKVGLTRRPGKGK